VRARTLMPGRLFFFFFYGPVFGVRPTRRHSTRAAIGRRDVVRSRIQHGGMQGHFNPVPNRAELLTRSSA